MDKLSKSELENIELKPGGIAEFLNGALSAYDTSAISADNKKSILALTAIKFGDLKASTCKAQLYRAMQFRTLLGLRNVKTASPAIDTPAPSPALETSAIVPVNTPE